MINNKTDIKFMKILHVPLFKYAHFLICTEVNKTTAT